MYVTLKVDWKSLKKADNVLEAFLPAVQSALKEATERLRDIIVERTPVDTGHFKRSWSSVSFMSGGLSFSADVSYAHVLEEGLYPSVGPKTVAFAGGIYSSQAPGGIIGPVVESDLVVSQIAELIAAHILKGIDYASA